MNHSRMILLMLCYAIFVCEVWDNEGMNYESIKQSNNRLIVYVWTTFFGISVILFVTAG